MTQNAEPARPRPAATLVLLRKQAREVRLLMGQRGAGASFMPNKFVFPGGRVDDADMVSQGRETLAEPCRARLSKQNLDMSADSFALAAIRETFEETGLRIARNGGSNHRIGAPIGDDGAASWGAFRADGAAPATDQLRFVFRAITPPSLPKRFDARFFIAPAAAILGDPDDFSGAGGELSHLAWTSLAEARALTLAFITNLVIEEIDAAIRRIGFAALCAHGLDRATPFFRHDAEGGHVDAL